MMCSIGFKFDFETDVVVVVLMFLQKANAKTVGITTGRKTLI